MNSIYTFALTTSGFIETTWQSLPMCVKALIVVLFIGAIYFFRAWGKQNKYRLIGKK